MGEELNYLVHDKIPRLFMTICDKIKIKLKHAEVLLAECLQDMGQGYAFTMNRHRSVHSNTISQSAIRDAGQSAGC